MNKSKTKPDSRTLIKPTAGLLALLSLLTSSCGTSTFKSKTVTKELEPAAADTTAQAEYAFLLSPKNTLHGKSAPARVLANVSIGNKKDQFISGKAAESWKVTLLTESGTVLAKDAALGEIEIKINDPKSEENVIAQFSNSQAGVPSGRAQTKLLFDLEGPSGSLNWWPAADSDPAEFRWNFDRVEDVDLTKSALVICSNDEAAQKVGEQYQSGGEIPDPMVDGCMILATDQALKQGVIRADTPQAAATTSSSSAQALILSRDIAGNTFVTSGKRLSFGEAALVLEATASESGTLKSKRVSLDLALFRQVAAARTSLSGDSWSASLKSDRGAELKINPFTPTIVLDDSFLVEGKQRVTIQAEAKDASVLEREGLKFPSNEIIFEWTIDTTAPTVTTPVVSLEGSGQLFGGTLVRLQWSVQDVSPITEQVIESSTNDGATWKRFADTPGNSQTLAKAWPGAETSKTTKAQFRIRAKDSQGLEGISPVATWREQFFNLAVLTKSVKCFWCHMTIVGDVGGIFAPASGSNPTIPQPIHQHAGKRFEVTGKFYSNILFPKNEVPDPVPSGWVPYMERAIPPAQRLENYANSPMPVFPKNNQWPVFTFDQLRPKTTGLLEGTDAITGAAVAIDRFRKGHLAITGTAENPIKISGEVLIEGDLVIAGTYTGLGTIYARNIFIANDLKAKNSPFPFDKNEAVALVQAKEAIAQKKDGIYLAAIQNVIVGAPEAKSRNGCTSVPKGTGSELNTCPATITVTDPTIPTPYSWLARAKFKAVGRRATFPKITIYASKAGVLPANQEFIALFETLHQPGLSTSETNIDDLSSDRTSMEVSQVDAFLYAGVKTQIRVYINFLLNGGVMSPELDLLSSFTNNPGSWKRRIPLGYRVGSTANPGELLPVNSFNNLDLERNEIRFDWRLRAGGFGLESLKEYFQ